MTDEPIRYNQTPTEAVESLRAYAKRGRTPQESRALNRRPADEAWDEGFRTAIDIFDLITGDDPAIERAVLEEDTDV